MANKPYRDRAELYAMQGDRVYGGCYKDTGGFGVFGGGIDAGESEAEAAAREFKEETGREVRNVRRIKVAPITAEWLPPYPTAKLAERAKKYRGSRTYFLVGDLVPGRADAVDPEEKPNLKGIRLYRLDEAIALATPKTDSKELTALGLKRKEVLKKLKEEVMSEKQSEDLADGFLQFCQEREVSDQQFRAMVTKASASNPELPAILFARLKRAAEVAVPVQQPQAPESVAGLLARLKRAAEAAGTTQQAQVPRPASNLPTPAPQPQEQKPVRTWPGFFARNLGSLAGGIYAANRFGGTKLPQVLRAEALGRMAGSSAVAGAEQLVAGRSLSDAGREAAREVITTGVRNATIPHATQTGHELGSLFGHYRGLSPRASGTAANIGSEVGTVGGYALGHDTGRSIADWLIREPATKSAEADPKEKAEEPKSKAEESKPAKPVRTGLGYLARGLSGYAGGRLAETRLGGNKLPQQLAAYMGGRMAGSSTAAGAEQLLAGRDAGAAGREAIRDAVGTLGARSGRAFGRAGGGGVGAVGGELAGYQTGLHLGDRLLQEPAVKAAALPAALPAIAAAGRAAFPAAWRWLSTQAPKAWGAIRSRLPTFGASNAHIPENMRGMASSSSGGLMSGMGNHLLGAGMYVGLPMGLSAMLSGGSTSAPPPPQAMPQAVPQGQPQGLPQLMPRGSTADELLGRTVTAAAKMAALGDPDYDGNAPLSHRAARLALMDSPSNPDAAFAALPESHRQHLLRLYSNPRVAARHWAAEVLNTPALPSAAAPANLLAPPTVAKAPAAPSAARPAVPASSYGFEPPAHIANDPAAVARWQAKGDHLFALEEARRTGRPYELPVRENATASPAAQAAPKASPQGSPKETPTTTSAAPSSQAKAKPAKPTQIKAKQVVPTGLPVSPPPNWPPQGTATPPPLPTSGATPPPLPNTGGSRWMTPRNLAIGSGLLGLGAGYAIPRAYNWLAGPGQPEKTAFLPELQNHWNSLDQQSKVTAGLGGAAAIGALLNRLHSGESSSANTMLGLGGLGAAAYGLSGGKPIEALSSLLPAGTLSTGQGAKPGKTFMNPDGSVRIHDVLQASDPELQTAVTSLPATQRQQFRTQLQNFQPTTAQSLAARMAGVDINAQRERLARILG